MRRASRAPELIPFPGGRILESSDGGDGPLGGYGRSGSHATANGKANPQTTRGRLAATRTQLVGTVRAPVRVALDFFAQCRRLAVFGIAGNLAPVGCHPVRGRRGPGSFMVVRTPMNGMESESWVENHFRKRAFAEHTLSTQNARTLQFPSRPVRLETRLEHSIDPRHLLRSASRG